MPYDSSDYVHATKLKLRDALAAAFPTAAVYLTDRDNVPAFGPDGTFCLEATSSRTDVTADLPAVVVGLRIWVYVETVTGAGAEEILTSRAQKLEAVLIALTKPGPGAQTDWLATEMLQTVYLPVEKGRARRRPYLRAARTDWEVRLAACR